MNDLIIIGAGGLGREVAWLVSRINRVQATWNLLGFIDDNSKLVGSFPLKAHSEKADVYGGVANCRVLGTTECAANYRDAYFVIAFGSAENKLKAASKLEHVLGAEQSVRFAVLTDPSAVVAEDVSVGEGSIIFPNTTISVAAALGKHVLVDYNCTIGHDSVIGDCTTVYPGTNVAGSTNIGAACELGSGMQIIQGLSIGESTIVGAGAVVINNLPGRCTAVGCPARVIK